MKNHHSLPENFEVTVKKFDDGTFEQVTKFLNNNYANQFFSNYKTAYLGDRGIQFLSPEIANALKDNYFGKGLTLPMGMEEIENNTDNKGKKHINTWHEFNHQHGGIHLGIEENGGIFFNFDKNHKNLNGNLFSGFIEIKDKSTGEELVIVCDKGWFSCMSNTFSEKSNPIYKQWFEKRFESPSLLNEPIRDPNLYINFDIDKKTLSPQEEATFARYYSQRPNLVIQAAIDGIAKDNINVQKNKKADDTIGFKYTAPASTPRFFSLAVANDDFAKNIDYHIQTYAKQNGLKEKDIKTLKSKVQDVLKVSNELGKQIHFMVEDREDPNKIITILNKGANVNARDEHQQVPLHFAANAQNPDEQLIKTMLNKGANPNAQKSTGRTPLHFACKKVGTDKSRPHADIASLFVDYGGDPTIKDNNGITPQEEINKGKPQQIVQQPVQQHYAPQPQPVNQVSAYAPQLNSPAININSISNNNHTDVVNVKDHLGRTPIFYAVMSQNIDAVKELLNKGAKIDLEDATGLKPANYARALNNEEIINALAEHSIKQATQNMGQSTAKPLPPTPPAKARTSTTPPKPAHMEAHRNKEVPTSSLGNLAPKPCPTFRSTNEVGKKSGNEHGH